MSSTVPLHVLTERIYTRMLTVMGEFTQLRIADYDLQVIKEKLIAPVAHYLHETRLPKNGSVPFIKPLFVSGDPGIGKTTLLMVLDEALHRLDLPGTGSIRNLVVSGEIKGYFPYKGSLAVSPLKLFDRKTAALSARDWGNILRHWTYDEDTYRESQNALAHLIQQLRGKIVIVDEAEMEGYVYFAETLAQHGILILFTSNLGAEHVRLAPDRFTAIRLTGIDHRSGDIAKVCLPHGANVLFDQFSGHEATPNPLLATANASICDLNGVRVAYLDWHDLRNKPLMKDDFGHFFRAVGAEYVLLDGVPFFADPKTYEVGLTFLGHLSRFVNFVDAIHDCALPLLVRGTNETPLDTETAGRDLEAALLAYDDRRGGKEGKTAVIEWSRCLSRLRSREAFNQRPIEG